MKRLGNIVYFTGCVLAFCWFLLSIRVVAPSAEWGLGIGIGIVGGLTIWLMGGAVRYLMADR